MKDFDSYYKIYLDKTLTLAESMVIKLDSIAHSMNLRAYSRGYENALTTSDKKQWPYYLNLAGLYHISDTKIKVVSMDTLEEIEFTKENLELHTATKDGYQFGTKKYEELIERYPEQELLIFGVLNPVDIDVAIEAENGTILNYATDLIEANEYTLLDDLQEWSYGFFLNWYNSQYEMVDDLYGSTVLGVFYAMLVQAIMMYRKRRCMTNEAHSYHVRRYLASHGFLDFYLDNFTLKQSLRFYKNIAWIERNIGTRLAQEWLIKEAMTERFLPVADYTLRHVTTTMTDDIYPTINFKKRSINNLESISNTDDLTLVQLLGKEEPLALGNNIYSQDNEKHIEKLLQNSASSKLKTKVLESKVIDWTDSATYSLSSTLLNTWLDYASKGLFKSYVTFENYKRSEFIPLSAMDAYILYWYLFCRGLGLELEVIPDFLAQRVPLTPLPDEKTIQNKMTDKKHVPLTFIKEMKDLMIKPISTISISAFYAHAKQINKAANLQEAYVTTEQNMYARGYKEGVIHSFYQDRVVKPFPVPKRYDTWLSEKLIQFEQTTNGEYMEMAIKLFKDTTGVSRNEGVSVRSVQEAMVKLMIQLSSYSVHYIKTINASNIINTGDHSLRLSDNEIETYSNDDVRAVQCILDFETTGHEHYDEVTALDHEWDKDTSSISTVKLDLTTLVELNTSAVSAKYRVENTVDAEVYVEPIPLNLRNIPEVPGISSFINAPRSLQVLVLDAWDNDYDWETECDRDNGKEPFSWTIYKRDLSGFKYSDKIALQLGDLDGYDYESKIKVDIKDLDGYEYQDKLIFPKVEKMYGFAYLREFNTVSLDTLITGDLSIFRDDYPLWKTLPDNSGDLNGFNWEVTKRKFDLLKINTELDGWERTPIEKVLIDISLASGNLDGFTRLQLIDLADPDISGNLDGFKIKDYIDVSGTTTDKLEGFTIKTYLDISVDTNDKLDGLKEKF